MPGDPRPIGVFDSGMGGLTVLRALVARLPHERFVYLGDTARLPYGTKSAETVQAYALQATRLLLDQGVKMLVIACNTASAVALYLLEEAWEKVPVIGVIEPGARAGVAATRNRRIAVIATEGTVKGGAYARAIRKLMADAEIVQQPCQVFVALAEEGWTASPATHAAAEHYLGPLFEARGAPDTLVLGCTHFPVLADVIRKTIGEAVALVDSAETTAQAVADALARAGIESDAEARGESATRFFATDSPERFARVGAIFLGRPDRGGLGRAGRPPRLTHQTFGGGSLSGSAAESSVGSAAGPAKAAPASSAATLTSRSRPMSQGRPSSRQHRRAIDERADGEQQRQHGLLAEHAHARQRALEPIGAGDAAPPPAPGPRAISFATGLPMAAPDTAKPWRRANTASRLEIDPGADAGRERQAHLRQVAHEHHLQGDVDGGGEQRRLDRRCRIAAGIEGRGEAPHQHEGQQAERIGGERGAGGGGILRR